MTTATTTTPALVQLSAPQSGDDWTVTSFAQGTALDRVVIAPGLDLWIYIYRETAGARRGAVSDWLEIGIQLEGSWMQRGRTSGARHYPEGAIHTLNPGEPYDLRFAGLEHKGVVVGLSIDPERVVPLGDLDREVVLGPIPRGVQRALLDLAHWLLEGRPWGGPVPMEAASVVQRCITRIGRPSAPDPTIRARRLLERQFQSELYMQHIADEVGLHPATVARRFRRRYGQSPVEYRIKVRLNQAARVGWSRPELTVREIAEQCGIPNLPYFHRLFRSYYGTTPEQHRRRRFPNAR